MSIPILVTGGAGFIGRNLVAELNRRGQDDIRIVDRLGNGEKWENLLGLRFTELIDPDDFRREMDGNGTAAAQVVFHLGACSDTTEADADFLIDNNTRFSRELCNWTLDRGGRFIYASSAATYGDGSRGYGDDADRLDDLQPLNMYGYSKHRFDLWARQRGLLEWIAGIKYFNVYGPYEKHKGKMQSLVPKAVRQVQEEGVIRLFRSERDDVGDGEQQRDFVFVDDAVAVTLFFWENPQANGLFNCGAGRPRSWNDLARAVFAAMEREPRIEYIDMPEDLRGKYQYYTCAEIDRLRQAGCEQRFTSLEDGVRSYVRDYLLAR